MKIPAAVLAVLLLGAGCAGEKETDDRARTIPGASAEPSPSSHEEAKGTDKSLTRAQAKRALLTVADVPTGYSVNTEPDSNSDDEALGCGKTLDNLENPKGQQFEEEVTFNGAEFGTFLAESISVFGDEEDAERMLDDLADALAKCPAYESVDEDGAKTTIRTAPLSFPKIADDTLALALSATSGSFPFKVNMALVRVGPNILYMIQGGVAGGDAALLERSARRAVSKVGQAAA